MATIYRVSDDHEITTGLQCPSVSDHARIIAQELANEENEDVRLEWRDSEGKEWYRIFSPTK